MEIKTTTRKWGNSIGIRLPKEFVKKKDLKENMEVRVEVITENDFNKLDEVFGSLKRKASGQKIKDLGREGWKE
jgi:hypothetical protein